MSHYVSLSLILCSPRQWFWAPAVSASPGKLLEMQISAPPWTYRIRNPRQDPGVCVLANNLGDANDSL